MFFSFSFEIHEECQVLTQILCGQFMSFMLINASVLGVLEVSLSTQFFAHSKTVSKEAHLPRA